MMNLPINQRTTGPREYKVPDGDDRPRLTCPECNFIAYENPVIVAGAVVEAQGGILLCRRAIEPRRGFWTLPAGFMEKGETVAEAAAREAHEEAEAEIEITGLLAMYSLPSISQVQIYHRAHLSAPHFAAGPESLEVEIFDPNDLPEDIAFPTVTWAIEDWLAGCGQDGIPPAIRDNPPPIT
ncbi:MAG: NUDIX hydrolase [Alphaproteobacteria bacterium]